MNESGVPTVLVVDDDPDIRGVLAFTLEQAGFEVIEAADGKAALAALERAVPDCVVLDVMMPELDGYSVLRARRERRLAESSRFLMLTARTGDRDFLRGFESGADDYLTKPFDSNALVAKVHELLAATEEELAARRTAEIDKAELLARIESAFEGGPGPT